MRLFIAVNFNDQVKKRIMDVQELLRCQCLRGNFTRPENLHLTLVFIGEIPDGMRNLDSLSRIITDVQAASFFIPFNRTGCFTHSRKELWWIGAEPDAPGLSLIKDIHEQLLSGLLNEGFPADARPFNAHITLGREIKHAKPVILDCPEIIVSVNRVSLMKSEHIHGVLTYTELMGKDL
ncbi:MAG: RNA 2',3'-cyclic phosphodiesterase [Treponema sp.]|nr:RNA 2',3'-cyclic phosphodiesterase [Treponema sp.]